MSLHFSPYSFIFNYLFLRIPSFNVCFPLLFFSLQRLISPTCLHEAFTHKEPKIAKRQPSHQCLLVLLESAIEKVTCKKLMKLTPGEDFTNILCAAFMCKEPKSAKNSHLCLLALLGSACPIAACNKLVKLTPEVDFTNILQATFRPADHKCA